MNESIYLLDNLIANYPNEVANILRASGLRVPRNADTMQITNIIQQNRGNAQMIEGLSAMILADVQTSNFSNAEGKVSIFKKIGSGLKNIFSRKDKGGDGIGTGLANSENTKKGGGFGEWFKKNSSDVLSIGKDLVGGLFNRNKGGNTSPSGGGGGMTDNPFGTPMMPSGSTGEPSGLSMGAKIGIGVGALVLIVGGVILIKRSGK